MPIFMISGFIGAIVIILFIIFFVVACISVERTKNETIEIRKLLENINKIQIAVYKKEFGIPSEKKNESSTIETEETTVGA